ncbi:MAG TPA: molybdopterin-binding protein [Gammaproteobacteria bacterium]|jgi:molybdenum cofactor synthesis domain-containing protein
MNEPISASVLIIGNEILSGKTQDANLQFLAGAFARLGITLAEARVVRDEHDVIAAVLNELRERHTYVFTTGGIGPTHDDITAESVALAFGVELTLSEEAARRISRGSRDLNPSRLKMAMIPQGASLIDNPLSHAPGFRMENVFVLAGIPSIARAMFGAIEHELTGGDPIQSQSLDIYRREGDFAASLSEIAARHTEVEIGSYPFSRDGRFGASIVVRGTSAPHIEAALNEIRNSLDTEN